MTAGGEAPGPPAGSAADHPAEYRPHGRDRELGVLASLVGRLGDAGGGALVSRGEPGIGKSALLATATARARDRGIRVLPAVGVQSEARLPFAGLHQLLRPVLPLAERLPVRQRTALLAAFGPALRTTGRRGAARIRPAR